MLNRRNFLKLAGAVGAAAFLDMYNVELVQAVEQAGEKGCQARMDAGAKRLRLYDIIIAGESSRYL